MPICRDVIKTRELRFSRRLSGADDAAKAEQLLKNIHGIESVYYRTNQVLRIRYDIQQLTLQMIEAALRDVGFQLKTGLLTRAHHSLIAYCEDTQRASLGLERAGEQSLLDQPDTMAHDPRPHNWRNYL